MFVHLLIVCVCVFFLAALGGFIVLEAAGGSSGQLLCPSYIERERERETIVSILQSRPGDQA